MQPITTSERKCCIKGCDNISMFKQSHQFPSMPDRCNAWLRAIGNNLDDELLGQPPEKFKRRIVCVDHFDKSCISAQSSRFLKRSAVPTIFNEVNADGSVSRAGADAGSAASVAAARVALPTAPRQPAVTYRTIVIPKKKPPSQQKSFYINKTSEPSPAHATGPTLLIEPLANPQGDNDKRSPGGEGTEEMEELPMFYMSSQHNATAEKGKPALKITKVYPNRKPPKDFADESQESNVETMMVERETFPTEYLEDWDEHHLEPESPASDSEELQGNLVLDTEDFMETEEIEHIQENIQTDTEEWSTADGESKIEISNNNILEKKLDSIDKQNYIKSMATPVQPIYVEPSPRCTDSTADVPDCIQYLLLGGGTASVAAARAIRHHDPTAKILIVTQEYAYPYRRHLLSKPQFWRSGDLEDLDAVTYDSAGGRRGSVYHEPVSFYTEPSRLARAGADGGVGVARGYTVRRVDAERRAVVMSAPGRPDKTVMYGSCMIATGVRGANIPVLETASLAVRERCVTLRSLRDARELWRRLAAAQTVVVVGGGYLGTEVACSLAHRVMSGGRPVSITHIFREAGVMWQVLPDYLARWSMRRLGGQGIDVCSNTEILNAYMKDERITLELSNAQVVEADLIVVCVGSVPNTEFAAVSGLETHPQLGGIIVNADFCVRKDLYAAGDVACYYSARWGRRRVEHARHAALSGRICGLHMCGADAPRLPHTELRSHLGQGLRLEAIGIVDSNLEMMGAFPNLTQLEGSDKNYERGVVFYLQQSEIVGVLMWNLRDRMHVARRLLDEEPTRDGEISELADLFIVNTVARKSDTEKPPQDETEFNSCYQCHHCDQQYSTAEDISQHLSQDHTQTISCDMCDQTLQTEAQLKTHYANHLKLGRASSKPVQCKICPIVFTSRARFVAHMKKHHNMVLVGDKN